MIEKTGKDIVLLENYISYWKKVLEQMTDLAVRFSEGDISIKIEIISMRYITFLQILTIFCMGMLI